MTAYCFVASPGFSNRTCILGALPVGTASAGFTYSPAVSCERTITAVSPINISAHPTRFILLIALISFARNPSQRAYALGSGGVSCRRRHEFGTDRISDRLPQNLIDRRECVRVQLPVEGARHSFQFLGMSRAPQRRGDSGLVQHPTHGEIHHVFSVSF